MKQNVILFSLLAIGVLYIWYTKEENTIPLKEIKLESTSPDSDEKLKPSHARKLLFANTGSELEDISSTSIDMLRESRFETRINKIPHSFRLSGKKYTGRRKRYIQNPKEQLAWKFNLNVTRYENKTPKNKVEYPAESKDTDSKLQNKYLGMSMSVSGNGPDQSLEELYQAWDSVGQFMRNLFGGNLEDLKEKGHGVSVDIDPLPNGTKDMPLEFFMEGSGDEEVQKARKRKGKFLLGLFGFGGNSENPPRDEGSGEPLDIQEFNVTEVLLDVQSQNSTQGNTESSNTLEAKEDSIEIISNSTIVATENTESKGSVTSSSNLDETLLTINSTTIDTTPGIPSGEETFSEGNCTDCEIKIENVSIDRNGSNEETSTASMVNTTVLEFPFNAEALTDFCNALFNRLHIPQQTVERSAGVDGSGSFATDESGVTNTQPSNILTDEPRHQNLGFFERIFNRIIGRKNIPVQEVKKETRGARLINIGDLFGEFGSGRSPESGVSGNFEFDNFQAGINESDEDDEQFLSDCEEFFKSVQTDTRPNIFDLIHPHPGEVTTEFITLKSGESQASEHQAVENLTIGELALDLDSTSPSEGLKVSSLNSGTDEPNTVKDELLSKSSPEVQFTTEAQDKLVLQENDDRKSFESSTKTEEKVFTEVQERIQNDSSKVRNLIEETINPNFWSTELSNLSLFTNSEDNELSTEELNATHLDEQRSFNLFGFGGSGAEEVKDEGSADVSNTNERSFGLFNFGSGEREIKEMNVTAVDSTESFKEQRSFLSFGSGGRGLVDVFNSSEWEGDEDSKSTTEGKGRFFGFGSGERELRETTTWKSDAKSDLYFPEESIVSTLSSLSKDIPTIKCNDCVQNRNNSNVLSVLDTSVTARNPEIRSENRICIDCETSTQDEFIVQNSFLANRENQEKDGSTIGSSEETTLKNDPRLIGTIFLTGSGEGGLFVDNKGPINLVQESEFTSQVFQKPPQSGRGARRHDNPDIQIRTREQIERNFQVTEPVQFMSEKDLQELTGINSMSTFANKAFDDTTVVLETVAITTYPTTIESKIIDQTIAPAISFVTSTSGTELAVTTSGVTITTSQKITPRTKVLDLPKRLCSSASECNRTLNERCISTGTTAMCNCGRSYVRSPETGKCESPVVLKTSLKLPGEAYHQDLKNRNSERYQKKRNESIETMMLLLGDDPDLFRTIAGVEVSGFEEGSLVVHWEITLAPNDTSIPTLIQLVDADLKEAFEDEELLGKAPLNVTNAVLMAVTSDMDPCEKTERNYCSINADCIPDSIRGFECRCREDYIDKSMDIGHPGEVCVASCPPYYCGDHGECNLKEDGNRHCSCNGWYFGNQCEIPGIIVIAGFAAFNVVLIIAVVTVVCICRKRRYRQSRFYGQNQVRFQPNAELSRFTASPRLADTIAMDDVRPTKASKYSTPLHNAPTIQIKSPSIMGSSVDYDYESTFDRTPSAGGTSVEVYKIEETHQV